MATDSKLAGYKLPIKPEQNEGKLTHGFVTPRQDRSPQVHSVPPKRVIPIVFIPGIMGSNLRMNAERQSLLNKKNNIAWRPDNLFVTIPTQDDTAAERQLRLDPTTTELDIYEPGNNSTGDVSETVDARNKYAHFSGQYNGTWKNTDGPLLQSDRPGTKNSKTRDKKARERGWGEIFFGSYEAILSTCEVRLNGSFSTGFKDAYLTQSIIGISPSAWQATETPKLSPIDEKSITLALKGCWFPVHAMGYNWLKSNRESGVATAERILTLIQRYQQQGYQCEKVILVTHSMGGLVARAVIHPEMGGIGDKVLGVVHGVMPAIGAGTAYKRMRCGFEGSGIPVKIIGATGDHVTSVLGNSQGGLELLPNKVYGNDWLQLVQGGRVLKSLPRNGDPYEEIYKINNKWFGLLREQWLNPANSRGISLARTHKLLDGARVFHDSIGNTYHEESYAHYGADPKGVAWKKVVWEINPTSDVRNVDALIISRDDKKGNLDMTNDFSPLDKGMIRTPISATMIGPTDPGDQTVPSHSADAQLRSGKFKGIFRQSGYEHQGSYSNNAVIAATIYSLFRIISTMKWSKP